VKKVKYLLFLRFRIFCERLPKVVFTEGEEVGVSHAPDVGCPPVTRLVTRYVQNAHLKSVKGILYSSAYLDDAYIIFAVSREYDKNGLVVMSCE
jgi:hypothetical protein